MPGSGLREKVRRCDTIGRGGGEGMGVSDVGIGADVAIASVLAGTNSAVSSGKSILELTGGILWLSP